MDFDKEAIKRKLAELQALIGGDAMMGYESDESEVDETDEKAPARDVSTEETMLANEPENNGKADMEALMAMAGSAPTGRGPTSLTERAALAAKDKMSKMKK